MNKQRENIYALRRELLEGKIRLDEERERSTRASTCMALAEDLLDDAIETLRGHGDRRRGLGSATALRQEMTRVFGLDAEDDFGGIDFAGKTADEIRDALWERIKATTRRRKQLVGRGAAAARRARHHAADRRRAVEGPPLQPRPPEGRHRPARLRPARSARRVQARELRAVPGHEGAHRRGDGALSVVAAAGVRPTAARTRPPRRPARRAAASRSILNEPRQPSGRRSAQPRARRRQPRPVRSRRSRRRARRRRRAPSRRCGATSRRSAATIRARAAAARNTRSATERGVH